MNLIRSNVFSPLHAINDRCGLAVRLFSYFAIILLLILGIQNVAEIALVKAMLRIPDRIQEQMRDLANQAEIMIADGDMYELADWERGQPYYLFVLNKENRSLSGRDMHPHFEFKLAYIRQIDSLLESRVNRPIIEIPLRDGNRLVIQFPLDQHPAHHFKLYFGLIKIFIAALILCVFSLLLARYLQRPLNKLQEASRRLSEGDFSVRVTSEVGRGVKEFRELAHDFDHMTFRIQTLAEQQKRLIRDVSHELRTPLARHNLALHLLRKRTPEENQHLLDRLEHESDEMNNLVTEILEFSRIENASYSASLEPLQLEIFCQAQVLESQMGLKPKQSLTGYFDNETPLILADSRLLLRVIKNLLVNASKYAGEQAIISLTVQLSQEHEEQYVQVIIEDDGKGIEPQHLKRIFDPFTRLEEARDKQSGGYGLGLAIVKESMALMKGQVEADNRLKGGLRITLLFPVL
ncbi:sensor histidine kinase [Photobacterium indicum]|uniref:histidine kinase n=1 Tax=Photobacterium indicum TaxID=81447 RepID=A0A2T3L5T3_9GAMM|nr:sensor histidine kinase [Photobacterium indicum]PSV45238.1 two-component sensor histidine kinase [Photobacterium indicum]